MGDMIESGYIKGKFEQTLPFFMLGEPTNSSGYSEQKRNLRTKGAFNVVFNRKHTNPSFVRGYILPIALCMDDEKRDFFLKLQRVVKKNKNKKDFSSIINNHLEKGGFGYLKLSLYSNKNGYILFKIKQEVYAELLSKGFYYVTKILDKQGGVVEILGKKEFKYDKYSKFLEAIYEGKNLLKRTIVPFRLVYVFENATTGQYYNYEKYWGNPYSIPLQNLQNYFDVKKDCKLEKFHKIELKDRGYGWIDICMETSSSKFTLKCSDAFDPFLSIYDWLHLVKSDNRNYSFQVDEEGIVKIIEAYPFEDKLYLIVYDDSYEEMIHFEGILNRDNFLDNFLSILEDFLVNTFNVNKEEQFWRGEGIYRVRDLFIKKNMI